MADQNLTCNEEMDSFQVGDQAIDVTGAIIKAEKLRFRASAPVKSNVPDRYIMSNLSGRQFRILLWPPRNQEFEGRLLRQIVKISRARIMQANQNFMKPGENLMDIEISVQTKSTVEILGPIPVAEQQQEEPVIPLVPIREVGSRIGETINLECFVRSKIGCEFYKNYSFGCGALTDLRYRLPVNVTSFNADKSVEEGTRVKVKGRIRENEFGTLILQMESLDDLEVLDDARLTENDMRLGFLKPPRPALEENRMVRQERNQDIRNEERNDQRNREEMNVQRDGEERNDQRDEEERNDQRDEEERNGQRNREERNEDREDECHQPPLKRILFGSDDEADAA